MIRRLALAAHTPNECSNPLVYKYVCLRVCTFVDAITKALNVSTTSVRTPKYAIKAVSGAREQHLRHTCRNAHACFVCQAFQRRASALLDCTQKVDLAVAATFVDARHNVTLLAMCNQVLDAYVAFLKNLWRTSKKRMASRILQTVPSGQWARAKATCSAVAKGFDQRAIDISESLGFSRAMLSDT
eukprot:CAMPEP_0172662848 /NCGR_PEP_ID=MMETSP1074-20121228/5580_1 /TAXON_ID=2916 /ORGANISM="Ceratium fusus, Strain PA161109" /LENGTH=185 /DNA_ID=CAMNT_0013478783 /DNA_START=821 /DNA_END=1378 /DNA_ORIENTATION=-